MRIIIPQPQLLKSLQIVERAVNDRSAIPVLGNVLLEVHDNELILTATDLDVGVRYRLPLVEQADRGAITLPARRLSTIVRELPEEPLTIEARKNHTIALTCGASQFRIPGLPPEDFPTFPPIERTTTLAVSQSTLKALIAKTIFAMSLEETRFVLNGALLRTHNHILTLVATDGRRLAVASAKTLAEPSQQISVVVPAKTIRELGRLLQEDQEAETPVTIAMLKDNQLAFQFSAEGGSAIGGGDVTVMTRLIEGQFPQYEGVVPAPSKAVLTCSRQPLFGAIRRVSLMTTATSQAVVFELAKDRLVISKESAEFGSAREELAVTYAGEPMTIAFNPEFWLDALKALEAEEIPIEVTAPDKPAVVRLPGFLYVVLPMKLA